ncbi:glycosyltransferase family 4 protein [Salinicoccus halodurans]|uniref:UDP-N-acetylglucosamine:LPS N-acetylglucosamine transferase n=1 Tax=Salinicoccus halodurans TaxID=407035 RepID=A0A0F7HK62_9STAP|nr:glycosyltransferase family 4 protein [Salinicoccus halodurans]AKG73456.1 hypothetical protein AAT16_04045 [Salinicoccus halodurans]SFK50849.1 UDP-N-acetylglucosamine:LPS N-acetylglucosamine transferase [Salinicoccus halodurans]
MEKEKDVLFLCQYFYPDAVSSAQLPFETATSLSENGINVDVLAGFPKEYNSSKNVKSKEKLNGFNIKRVKYLQLNRNSFLGRILNYFSFTLSVFLKFYSMKNYKMILVYSNPPILPLVASLSQKIFRTKVAFVSYDVYPEIAYQTKSLSRDSMVGKIMKVVNSIVFNDSINVIALSHEMKELLLQKRQGLKEDKVHVIPNWDTAETTREDNKSNSRLKLTSLKENGKFIVSYFGNLGIAQDVDTVLDTIYKVKNHSKIHFIFAGHGNKVEELKKYVRNNGISNISIYGFLTGEDFEEALKVSDFSIVSLGENLTGLAVPSKTYTYLRAATTVFAIMDKETDIVQDIEKYEAGFHIPHGESQKIIEKMDILIQDKNQLNQMKDNAANLYKEKYKRKLSTDKYTDVIKSILKEDTNVRK